MWLEALDTYDQVAVTFTTSVGEARGQLPADAIINSVYCTPSPNEQGRYYLGLDVIPPTGKEVTWVEAKITTQAVSPLCGQPFETSFTFSAVWIGTGIEDAIIHVGGVARSIHLWVQMGFGTERKAGETNTRSYFYSESNYRFYCEVLQYQWCGEPEFTEEPISSGIHKYQIYQTSELFGHWDYVLDDIPYHFFAHPLWEGVGGDGGDFKSELVHREDRLPGTFESPCEFSSTVVGYDFGFGNPTDFANDDLFYDPEDPGPNEWGGEVWSPSSFAIWDLNP